AGNSSTSAPLAVTVFNDTSDPAVTVIAPAAGATVSGSITISANITDNVGVTSVQVLIDGNTIATLTSAPYNLTWSTLTVANGWHELRVLARDAAGNTDAHNLNINVANDTTAPTVAISSPVSGATATGTVPVTAAASDAVGVTSVEFFVDGVSLGPADDSAPYAAVWSTSASANGAHTLTAVAHDAAGNVGTSAAVSVIVANDTTPPTIVLTGVQDGAGVAGVVAVAATATDDTAVASVEFFVDGAPVGTAMTTAPYQLGWDTTAYPDGAHILTAVARDTAGNVTTSAPMTLNVINGPASGSRP
ncbi:MAG TPA: Ig-like domain-containing protein, partial [Vicinamibacterales bacterium]|nr:Ig-like domain-containing protein [Vicinamibacterales bacterium]